MSPIMPFTEFLETFADGISGFLNGDAARWKAIASHRDDVTIMGAWGAAETGWAEASPRYDWAAARFQPSGARVQIQYLAIGEHGGFGYTVAIERSTVRVIGAEKPAPMALRVTHLFRRENGAWRMIHRHADPLMSKTAPADTLQIEPE
jgi:ketosteroid isomerase-like protein